MSTWRDAKNAAALARLLRAVPDPFPAVVLTHALGRPLIPPQPRLAVASYWTMHPLRADGLARALAARSGTPDGWMWQLDAAGPPRSLRVPPTPYRETAHARGPGFCCICGQPVFRFGWHTDLWNTGTTNQRAAWHACCVAAWRLWTAPAGHAALLRRRQNRRCALSAQRLLRSAEVDHRTPLAQVWQLHREMPWPELLAFWGGPNLQVINRGAHAAKTAAEASARAALRNDRVEAAQGWA